MKIKHPVAYKFNQSISTISHCSSSDWMARMLLTSFFIACKLVQMQLNSLSHTHTRNSFQAIIIIIFDCTHTIQIIVLIEYKHSEYTEQSRAIYWSMCCRKLLIYAHLSINYLQSVWFVWSMYVIMHFIWINLSPSLCPFREKKEYTRIQHSIIQLKRMSIAFFDWYACTNFKWSTFKFDA